MQPQPPSSPPTAFPDDALPTDAIVTRWQAGDREAFATLYRRFEPLLLIRVRRSRVWPLLAEFASPEDLVQEVWSRVVPAAQ